MEGPLFSTSCFGFKTELFPTYIRYTQLWGLGGRQTIMINQIASVEEAMPGVQQVKIETTGGRVYRLVIRLKDIEMFKNKVLEAKI